MLNDTFIQNKGITKTLIHENGKNSVNEIGWSADYDGEKANVSLGLNNNGQIGQYQFQLTNQDLEEFGKDGTKKISSLNQIEDQFKEALKYIEIVSFDAPYHFSIDETRKSSKSYQEKLQQINNKIAQIRQKCPTGDGIGKSGKCLP
jgi:hypothetical protein